MSPRPASIEAVGKHLQAALDAAQPARNPDLNRKIKAAMAVANESRLASGGSPVARGKDGARRDNMLERVHVACPRLTRALDFLLKEGTT